MRERGPVREFGVGDWTSEFAKPRQQVKQVTRGVGNLKFRGRLARGLFDRLQMRPQGFPVRLRDA